MIDKLVDGRGYTVYEQVDGKHKHTVFQSLLSDFKDLCAERTRYTLFGEVPKRENDAAACGTGVHAGIETTLKRVKEGKDPDWDEALQSIYDAVGQIDINAWTKFTYKKALLLQAEQHFSRWWTQVRDLIKPEEIEWKFSLPLHEDDERLIVAEGTIDLVDYVKGLVDWKTGSRPYQQREKQKSALQPTMYTWARTEHTGQFHGRFTYFVMVPDKPQVQELTVLRTVNDWAYLKKVALGYAQLVEKNLPVWPMNDSGWWCSDRWCPAWHLCKGKAG